MELVEYDQTNALEAGVVEDHSREYAFGHDFDAGAGADARIESGADADGLAHAFAHDVGHALGGAAGSNAPRLQ